MRRRASAGSLFLLELTLVIFFFAVTAAVYVQIFVRADMRAGLSVALTEGTLRAQDLAEAFYACGDDPEKISGMLPETHAVLEEHAVLLYFDNSWKNLPAEQAETASYEARLTIDRTGDDPRFLTGLVSVRQLEDKNDAAEEAYLYELPVKKYNVQGEDTP